MENDGDLNANTYVVIAVLTTMMAAKWLTEMDLGHTISAGQKEGYNLRWGRGRGHGIVVILFVTAINLTLVPQLFLEFPLKYSGYCYVSG